MERLVVVVLPGLVTEGPRGQELRDFARALSIIEQFCPWVTPIAAGVCALPARGPSRFFGGEAAVLTILGDALTELGASEPACFGVAGGLFAARLAARNGAIVADEDTAEFLGRWPVSVLGRAELTTTLARLGITTLGGFAALSVRHVFERFGADAVACHRVARAETGELGGQRDPQIVRRLRALAAPPARSAIQADFYGGRAEADDRATMVATRLQHRYGPESVLIARARGGRDVMDRAVLVPFGSPEDHDPHLKAPWPGQLPAPSPSAVLVRPWRAELVDEGGAAVTVTGRGLLSSAPKRCSIDGGPWQVVRAWAGPWPMTDRWWLSERRRARLQLVTDAGQGLLVSCERGCWSVHGIYD